MPIKFGFQDLRTTAELALAPGQPASRAITKPSGLKPGAGVGDVSPIGRIASAKSMASGPFSQLKARLQYKNTLKSLASSVSSTVTSLSTVGSRTASVNRDTSVFGVSVPASGEFFKASDLLHFSSLRPGTAINTPAFQSQLRQRKEQLGQIASRLSSIAGTFSIFGVSITENYNRQPHPNDDERDAPSTPKLAQGSAAGAKDQALKDKFKFVVRGAIAAQPKPTYWSRIAASIADPLKAFKKMPGFNKTLNMTFHDDKANQPSWSEPAPPYAAQWPYNHVTQTESGHLWELDDTPGAERVHIFHRSGSFIEMHPDGKVVYKSMNHGYLISMSDQYIKVGGQCSISVDGDASIFARGQINFQSDKDINFTTKQDFNVYAKNVNLRAKKKAALDGTSVDLRYCKLPGRPVFTTNGLAARIIPAALKLDFPELSEKLSMLQEGMTPPAFQMPTLSGLPKDNPLGNPLIYHATTTDAIAYRGRLFDTPEEVSDFELYQAHVDTRKALQDIPGNTGPQLPGARTQPTVTTPAATSLPAVDYLDRDAFRGLGVDPLMRLGGTSFTVEQLADSLAMPDVANHIADEL